jgi:hypothetical protein
VTFHRVQSSFVESYDKIQDKELTANTTSLKFGPYYIDMDYVNSFDTINDGKLNGVIRWSIDELEDNVKLIEGNDEQRLKGNLRDWLRLLGSNPGYAQQRKDRIISLLRETNKDLADKVNELTGLMARNPLYDIMILSSIKDVTKNKE